MAGDAISANPDAPPPGAARKLRAAKKRSIAEAENFSEMIAFYQELAVGGVEASSWFKKNDSAFHNDVSPRHNLSAGLIKSFPQVGFQLAVNDELAFAVYASYFHLSFSGWSSALYGGLITANYYTSGPFEGFWGQIGGGYYFGQATKNASQASHQAPTALATVGGRFRGGPFNLGLAVGAQGFLLSSSSKLGATSNVLSPIFVADLGWNF
jgi:hypothetical protein